MATKRRTTRKQKTTTRRKTRKAPVGAAARMRKITSEAKRIRKSSPKKKWTTCVKEASRKLF